MNLNIHDLQALLSAPLPAAYFAAVLVIAFLTIGALTALYVRGSRRQRRRYAELDGLHRSIVSRYYNLLATGGEAIRLVDPDAVEQAALLREYADEVRDLSDGRNPHDVPHVIARNLESIADELDPPEDEDDEDAAGDELEAAVEEVAR